MKVDPLKLTDRPWLFWPGICMLLLGMLMVGIRSFALDHARNEDLEVWFLLTEMAFLAAGLLCTWIGRPATLDEEARCLKRGGKVVRDLAEAAAIVVYRGSPEELPHHVIVVFGGSTDTDPDLAEQLLARHPDGLTRLAMHAITGAGAKVFFAAQGVRLQRAYPLAAELGQRLQLPILGAVGEHYAEIVPHKNAEG